MQPGDTITPGGNPVTKSEDSVSLGQDVASVQAPNPPIQDSNPTSNIPNGNSAQEEPSTWQYNQDEGAEDDQSSPISIKPVNWSASEYIDHEKNSTWFVGLAGLTVLAVAVIYVITRDIVTSAVIIIVSALFGITAKRKPRTLQYQVDSVGVVIDGKPFHYEVFKSFSVLAEGAFNSIQLMPLKRFMPPISLYFPPENEEQIVTTLGSYLPHEDRTHDPIDRLMRRVRF